MKKLGLLVMTLFMAVTLVACFEDETPKEYNNGAIQFRLAGDNDSVKVNRVNTQLLSTKVNRVNTQLLSTKVNKREASLKRFLIGDRPEIYFEYSRPEEFSFIEAQVVDSINPDTTFKIQGGTTNLDGYSIVTGHNRYNNTDYFRAIITLPEIKDIGEQRFALVQIKISINGDEFVEDIKPEDKEHFEVGFTVETEDLFLPIEDALDDFIQPQLWGQNRNMLNGEPQDWIHIVELTDLRDHTNAFYAFAYNITIDEKHKDYAKAENNILYFNLMGNQKITLNIEITIKGQVKNIIREYDYNITNYQILEGKDFYMRLNTGKIKGIQLSDFEKDNVTMYVATTIGKDTLENFFITSDNAVRAINIIVIDYNLEWLQQLGFETALADNLTVKIWNGFGDLIDTKTF